jgi:carbonic anhydrase
VRTYIFYPLLLVCAWINANAAPNDSPGEALQALIEGNQRYVAGKLLHPNRSAEARMAVKRGQRPFAAILGCADSRVSPEIVFDQGIGDLFVVRVAGNVAGPLELDSLEYALDHLGAVLILVVGHESCGAVDAVMQGKADDIEAVAALIEPAVSRSRDQAGDRLENAIKANVQDVVQYLKTTPVVSQLISQGAVDVVGGYYRLGSGRVEFID